MKITLGTIDTCKGMHAQSVPANSFYMDFPMITRRDLNRRKAFNKAIATMFPGDENKSIRRALRKCRSSEEVRKIPGIPIEDAEQFIKLFFMPA